MYKAEIVADSTAANQRLTSIEVTFPRYILAEFNTHRVFSRNSASSRAIPVKLRVQQVRNAPFVPSFTKNKAGMQATELVADAAQAEQLWLGAAMQAAQHAAWLADLEVHKQQANRVLEPYTWHTVLVTATDWENFFNLRLHPDAAPEIQQAAWCMKEAMDASTPIPLEEGQWHLPYVVESERNLPVETLIKISVARCAAVSYERQKASKTVKEYTERHDKLMQSGHWSPFEHQAKVATANEILHQADYRWSMETGAFEAVRIGNFQVPWLQYRKTIPGEAVFRP